MSDHAAASGRRTAATRTRRATLADAASELATFPNSDWAMVTGARTACTLVGDTAYQALLGHTLSCPNCQTSGGKCANATDLDNAWRRARSAAPTNQPAARSHEGGTR